MITPSEIRGRAAQKYPVFLKCWLRGENLFPFSLPVGKTPTEYSELRQAVERLTNEAKPQRGFGYTLSLTKRNMHRFGHQTLPEEINIETEQDYLKLIEKEDEFANFQADIALIRARLPVLETWLPDHTRHIIENHGDWEGLLQVCTYFLANPRPNLYIRELPLPLDTKFIERHEAILRRLLDFILPETAKDASESHFEQRYGLRYDEPLIRIRLLDAQGERLFGMPADDLSLPLSQLARLAFHGHKVIIVENKMTFLTLPLHPQTIAIWGKGFQISILKKIDWLADCPIWYWGDMDAQGFQILATLREHFPHVQSILMDINAFNQFRRFSVMGKSIGKVALDHLTESEKVLFDTLSRDTLRLEQERIPYAYVCECLHQALLGTNSF